MGKAYPPIDRSARVIRHGDKQFLAVIIAGSAKRPHFAGPAYIRQGSETVVGSEAQFHRLIADRTGKAYEILKFAGQRITVVRMRTERVDMMGPVLAEFEAIVQDCNAQYVTVRASHGDESIPLDRVKVSFDHTRNQLKLEVWPL